MTAVVCRVLVVVHGRVSRMRRWMAEVLRPSASSRSRNLHDRYLANCGLPGAAIEAHWQQWHPIREVEQHGRVGRR